MAQSKRQKLDLKAKFDKEDVLTNSTPDCVVFTPQFKIDSDNSSLFSIGTLVIKETCLALTIQTISDDRDLFDFSNKKVPRYLKPYIHIPQISVPVFKGGYVYVESGSCLSMADLESMFETFDQVTVFAKNNNIIIKILHV